MYDGEGNMLAHIFRVSIIKTGSLQVLSTRKEIGPSIHLTCLHHIEEMPENAGL